MAKLPPLELLESTHTFPGPYTFKAIGKNEEGFVSRVLGAARTALHADSDPQSQVRETEGGRHVCVTLTVCVEKAAEVHSIYKQLLDVSGLVLLL